MRRGKINPNLIKTRRSYTVEQLAQLLGCHKNSVRLWLRQGLETLDEKRPLLIHGTAARRFLEAKRRQRKQRCLPHELFCLRCHAPRAAANGKATYLASAGQAALLSAECARCGTQMFKRVSESSLQQLSDALELKIREASETPRLAA